MPLRLGLQILAPATTSRFFICLKVPALLRLPRSSKASPTGSDQSVMYVSVSPTMPTCASGLSTANRSIRSERPNKLFHHLKAGY